MTKLTDSIGLGIDAGGTFTDGAIVDLHTGVVLSKSKAPTIKEDLPGSIHRCLEGLDSTLLSRCILASLSTTFATNAIVEGKGTRAGLLLLGYDKYDLAKVQAAHVMTVKGRYDIRGRELEPLDKDGLRYAVRKLIQKEHVQAIAISGMCSVLNPTHENAAREIALEEADLPVVCGHELSMELDAIRRATTAYLNAQLLSVVVNLIKAVESEFKGKGIKAPLMVVRSDGSLMSISDALIHPIHTIFSGPAASGAGALYLSGVKDAIVVDIGGTTTDILLSESGLVRTSDIGAIVNGFAVSIPSVCSNTVGFGGDSHIRRSASGELTVGPERVAPICVLADCNKSVLNELENMKDQPGNTLCQPVEFFMKGWFVLQDDLSKGERKILEALADGPKSRVLLAELCDCPHPSILSIERLERVGGIIRAGLTPTDILHAMGRFTRWNSDAARMAAELYSKDLKIPLGTLCELVLGKAEKILEEELICAALDDRNQTDGEEKRKSSKKFKQVDSDFIQLSAKLKRTVIGIGAPVEAYLPDVCKALGTKSIIPEHAEVANGVGAIVGRIVMRAKAVVSPLGNGAYSAHTPVDCKEFGDLTEAEEYGMKQVRNFLEERVHHEYKGFRFRYDLQKQRSSASSTQGTVIVDSVIIGTAVCTSMPRSDKHVSG